jgi:Putative copper export protein
VTGTYQAWREVWPIPALWSTSYGQLLLAKVIGFLLIVGVAYFSRQAVQRRYVGPSRTRSVQEDGTAGSVATLAESEPRELGEDRRMVRRLRTSVGIELVLGIVVLAVAAVLVSQAPARNTYIKPVDKTVALASGGTAEVELTPAKVGQNTLTVKVLRQERQAGRRPRGDRHRGAAVRPVRPARRDDAEDRHGAVLVPVGLLDQDRQLGAHRSGPDVGVRP